MNAMADSAMAASILDAQARTPPGQNRGPSLLAIQVVMMVFAATAVVLRFISRRIGPGELWWDDWVILAALIPSLGANIINIVAIKYGLGRHVWEAPNYGLGFVKTNLPVEMMFILGVDLAKGSVLLLYRRIFGVNLSKGINIVAAIVVSWCVAIELVIVCQCQPISAFWDVSVKGKCLDFRKLNLASAIGHTITTSIVISLPQPLIWKLNMSWSKKIAYSGICFLGICSAVASVGRIVTVNLLPMPDVLRADFTWYAVPALIWYSVEPAVGIVCACLPCVGPIFRTNPFTSSKCTRASSHSSGNSLDHIRISDADDASIIRRLGATCETSIYTAARDNMSKHYEIKTKARRRGGSDGRIYVRNSTHIT